MPAPRFDDALAFARDLIRIPSPSGQEGAVADRVRAEMERLAFDDVSVDEAGNVIGVVRGRARGPSVMLSSHLDIVAAGEPADWEHPPFEGAVAGGFLHGRGAMDIKGPLAIQTYAAAALKGRAPGDVIVAHTVQEETGGLGMRHLLEAGRVKPDAVVIGESTHGDVCIGHRGRAEIEVIIHGLAGHASAPERARNALALLPAVIEGCWNLRGDQPSDPVLGTATVTPTSVASLPESRNVIPDRVTVVLDWRTLPGTESADLLDQVKAVVGARLPDLPEGFGVEVRVAENDQTSYTGMKKRRAMLSPGFLMGADHPMVRAAARAVGTRADGGSPATVRPWAFATDGGWTCGVHGIPTIGFAPGEERHAHTNRERLDLDEARWSLERYPELVLAMQQALGG